MSLGDLSDQELLAEYAKRSGSLRDAVVNELFERHYARVARWCLRFAGDRDAAADLAQDVFLKAHRHLGSFKGASRFSTWLYTIVRNESPRSSPHAAGRGNGCATSCPRPSIESSARSSRCTTGTTCRSMRLPGF
ncbi:MAG: hypothetical protein DMF96_08195 [Acidobacteria bacterium]|nr:MAG: hypothetical protein DMF96_08195 [Acidobacteriota bacterium]